MSCVGDEEGLGGAGVGLVGAEAGVAAVLGACVKGKGEGAATGVLVLPPIELRRN